MQPQPSAVLIPVFPQDGDLWIVLVERAAGGAHGGQLAFPGGKWEPADATLLDTALREAEEEIGLPRSQTTVLAALEPLDTRTTGFRVHPFLARVPADVSYRPQATEIARVLPTSLRTLQDPARRRQMALTFPTWPKPMQTECVTLDDCPMLWGLTLRILDRLVPRLAAGEWARELTVAE